MNDLAVRFRGLTKHFGTVTAVQDLTFDVGSGRVVGLLGRNGAGKSTSLRALLGLIHPDTGEGTVFGHPYPRLPRAAHRVGVSIEGLGAPRAATGRRALEITCRSLGLPARRVDEVLDTVGLADAANRRVRRYSTGMRQRLALGTALLADPDLLILDEPANGLDPDGIRWLRDLLRRRAADGQTVLLSSHLLADLERTVDDVVILDRTVLYSGTLAELTGGGAQSLEDRFFDVVNAQQVGSRHA